MAENQQQQIDSQKEIQNKLDNQQEQFSATKKEI